MINSLKTLVFSANAPFISGGGNSHVSNHFQHRSRMATVALLLLTFSFFNISSARADVCDSWLTDGTGLNRYAGIYRVLCPMNLPTGGYVVNIQEPVSGTPAIYFGNMGTVTDCSLGTGNYTVNGTGLYLHLSALTSHYTEVTITSGGVNYTFTVEYKNGGKLYFVKPQGWSWSNVYAYMWNGGNNNNYPGTAMTTNESVTLEHCTADIYEVAYNSAYNKLKFNDNGSNGIDNLDISGEDMYYVPSIMSGPTNVANWKWCASQGVNLRIGDAANNYYTDDPSHKFAFAQGSGHTLTTTVTLAGNTVYYFKLEQTQQNKWYTNHGASNTAGEGQMTSSNCTNWDMAYNGENDAPTKILTTEPGEYTFTYNYTSDRLSVTYPISEPTTVPADPEDLNDCQIKSIFGASLFPNAGVTTIEWDEPLNVANQTHTIAGKDVLQITFTSAHKTMLKFSELDLTGYTHVHFDVWSPVARDLASSILCDDGGYKGENVSHVENLTAQTWKSVDFALSSLDGMSDYYDHAQALIVNMGVGTTPLTSTFYITNIYFYKTTSDETCYADCGVDVARGKQTWAGVYENADTSPDKAVDGTNAQWQTGGNQSYDNQWWVVDLGHYYKLDQIQIQFENARTKHMLLQTRKDKPTSEQMASTAAWTTIQEVRGANDDGSGTILGNYNTNTYNVSGKKARYVRFKTEENTHNNAYGCKIRLFKVCVSGFATDDSNPPTMVSATYVSNNDGNTGVILKLTATDSEGEVSRFRLDEEGGGSIFVNTDGSHRATLDGIASGAHTYHVYAIDGAGNVSANYEELSFCFVNSSVNLALHATTTAGHTEGDAATTANAVDGDNDTQWNGTGATAGTNEWFMVDLGRKYDLREVKILWSKTGGEDDGGTYPVNYKLQGSRNGTDFYTFAHYSSKTETGQRLDYTTTDPLPARYVRVWVDQHSTYAMGIRELEVYSKDECFVEQEPVITFAEITNLTPSGVTVSCDAYANTTNMAGMRFYYELTNTGSGLTTTGTLTHTDGSITVTGLAPNSNYSLKIYAEITSSSARSTNFKELTFNLTYSSLHYLTEETECNWQAGLYNTEWQFAFTDRYSPTEKDGNGAPLRILEYTHHTISHQVETDPPTIQYKLYEAGYNGIWTSGGNLFFRNPKDKPLKMYALGTEKFVCNLDELYVSGDAVGSWWETTYTPNRSEAANYQMRYDDETGLFSWTGDVVPGTGKNFKIVIRDIRGVDATADIWAYNRIMQANAIYDREWTRATLYFDMSTWTWWWESAMDGCVREGGPGVVNTDNGGQPFTDGYKLNSYVVTEDEKQYFVVEAEPLDAVLNNAILHIYKDESSSVTEVSKEGYKTYTIGSTSHTYYRFKKLVSDIPEAINGIIRYYVKFEGPDGVIRNTKYHYFDLPQNECAPDTWIIYHHGQAPDGERETFDGGQIVQPIEYRRKFDLDTWYSLYLPFEVTAVKVISGGTYYDLLPYYRTDDGTLKGKQYIIRKARPVENMPIANVENRLPSESPNGWFDPSESEYSTFLPKKNTPYIIQFHNKYYEDKWIAFFGRWYSTIDTDFPANAAPTSDEVVNIYGNNTMKNQFLSGQCYQLNYDEYDSYAWTRFDDVTLYPFECYILANATTTAKYRILRRGAAEDTPTGMEDVYEESGDIRVYTIAGQYLCTLHNMSPDEAGQHLRSRLTEGVYILRTPALSYKLIIGGL